MSGASGRRRRGMLALSRELSPPASSGAVVMGTGIVSIALWLADARTLARVFLALAALAWVLLAAAHVRSPMRGRGAHAVSPAILTAVAATDVLGSALLLQGGRAIASALLALALLLWLVLMPSVLRSLTKPAAGTSFMVVVSSESLAVLAAALASHRDVSWLLDAALAPFVLGLASYPWLLYRFDLRELRTGSGDHWVAGGALAIAALAAAQITSSASALHVFGDMRAALHATSLTLWVLAAAWLPVLLTAEASRPRLRYDVRRWSTVFPVGMYAASGFGVAKAIGANALAQFARPATWVGVGVWVAVSAGMIRHGLALARGEAVTRGPDRTRPRDRELGQ